MLRLALLFVFALSLAACTTAEAPSDTDTPAPGQSVRYLALGDSYTIGESVPENERWPVQLAAKLRTRGLNVVPPEIIARTGWTTDELDAAIDAADPQETYDLVTLLIGVNNQYRGRAVEAYEPEFEALLQRAIGFAGDRAERVVVLSIPDWGVTEFAEGRDRAQIATEIDAYNAAARAIAEASGVAFVDITPISRQFPDLTAEDGLHPSGAQYTRWADAALPVVLERLTD